MYLRTKVAQEHKFLQDILGNGKVAIEVDVGRCLKVDVVQMKRTMYPIAISVVNKSFIPHILFRKILTS